MSEKRTSYHHGDLRRALIEQGIEILETEGLDRLSLRRVARATGVSPTAPYSHFKDKGTLLANIALVGFARLTRELVGLAEQELEPCERLKALGRGYVDFALRNRSLFRLMFGPASERAGDCPELYAVANSSFQVLLDTVTELLAGVSEGEELLLAATSLWSLVHGLAGLLLDGQVGPENVGTTDLESLPDRLLEPLLRGVRAPESP
ncbi:MAG: TetR/AcrR family transcriptional regulator [bacterium]|nr:TetR/AcrR family transcriptional regulator [bacterium]